jgi:uncharacterized C2H2 Zn-finger protein
MLGGDGMITCAKCNGMFPSDFYYRKHVKTGGCQRRQDAIRYRRMKDEVDKRS